MSVTNVKSIELISLYSKMSCFYSHFTKKELDIFEYSEINSLVLTQLRKHEENFILYKIQAIDR